MNNSAALFCFILADLQNKAAKQKFLTLFLKPCGHEIELYLWLISIYWIFYLRICEELILNKKALLPMVKMRLMFSKEVVVQQQDFHLNYPF
ncbi:hypothetical protein [Bacillus sp. OV322]|uniref:hypothetical protein n=1 Tax=Bacillus sp. OV322 TaxID=1882764 RepID=UPI0015A57CB9|nr:hypothetical protein [Bacillus sp. OV322]